MLKLREIKFYRMFNLHYEVIMRKQYIEGTYFIYTQKYQI